jgi:hypothetical protein
VEPGQVGPGPQAAAEYYRESEEPGGDLERLQPALSRAAAAALSTEAGTRGGPAAARQSDIDAVPYRKWLIIPVFRIRIRLDPELNGYLDSDP